MNDNISEIRKLDLCNAAMLIALALGMVGVAALLSSLLDLLVVFFLGIVVAAALQPGHVRLCRLGVPKGLAVLLIYLFFILGIALVVLFIGPVLIEQIRAFAVNVPEQYANFVEWLHTSSTPLLQRLGNSIPPFAVLAQNIADLAPTFFANAVGVVTSTVSFFTYLVVVLAIGFYWTMEVPRVERLILSLFTVAPVIPGRARTGGRATPRKGRDVPRAGERTQFREWKTKTKRESDLRHWFGATDRRATAQTGERRCTRGKEHNE